jgi:tRNA U34 2-thiouridine synthase MnmA/TrmU
LEDDIGLFCYSIGKSKGLSLAGASSAFVVATSVAAAAVASAGGGFRV